MHDSRGSYGEVEYLNSDTHLKTARNTRCSSRERRAHNTFCCLCFILHRVSNDAPLCLGPSLTFYLCLLNIRIVCLRDTGGRNKRCVRSRRVSSSAAFQHKSTQSHSPFALTRQRASYSCLLDRRARRLCYNIPNTRSVSQSRKKQQWQRQVKDVFIWTYINICWAYLLACQWESASAGTVFVYQW